MRIIRAIVMGAVVGAALFFLPFFILRGVLFILFAGFVIRLIAFGAGRRGGWRGRGFNPMWADKIRNMSDEEYNNFKQNWFAGCGRRGWDHYKPATEKAPDSSNI